MRILTFFVACVLLTINSEGKDMNNIFTLTSSAFEHNENIPSTFTCDGKGISPALQWDNVPNATKSFALIVDDPDAPQATWVHWVVFNLPASTRSIAENAHINSSNLGSTSFKDDPLKYGGPCPPNGTHRYFFKLYALDSMLSVKPGVTADDLMTAMENHILGQAELIGRYQRVK